jgi:prepilin-type N-terminal cleavage/methylation domain-containing protein
VRRAFTLAELIVTLAIIAVAAAVTVPAIAQLGRQTQTAPTARAVLDLLHSARASALEKSATVTLVIDPATAHWWAAAFTNGESRALGEGRLSLEEGASITANVPRARWSFSPNGTASGDTVVAHERDGSARPIAVEPWNGEAHADAR